MTVLYIEFYLDEDSGSDLLSVPVVHTYFLGDTVYFLSFIFISNLLSFTFFTVFYEANEFSVLIWIGIHK
jgi:hypothetical protein